MRMRSRAPGFTLIELMMVVAILGILAVIAVPKYQSYVYRSKTTEAVGFLSDIKAHQESYRADFGQYCNVSNTLASNQGYWPDNTPTPVPKAWGTGSTEWTQLGASPGTGSVLFRYRTAAGPPGTTPSNLGAAGALGYTGNDFWFVSGAIGDLDGDGTFVTFESYSHGQGLYIDQATGWE
jgi:prepilin-type N-terminal cleavage/methylation domain-containing protein